MTWGQIVLLAVLCLIAYWGMIDFAADRAALRMQHQLEAEQ